MVLLKERQPMSRGERLEQAARIPSLAALAQWPCPGNTSDGSKGQRLRSQGGTATAASSSLPLKPQKCPELTAALLPQSCTSPAPGPARGNSPAETATDRWCGRRACHDCSDMATQPNACQRWPCNLTPRFLPEADPSHQGAK